MQLLPLSGVFGKYPRFGSIEVSVDTMGKRHCGLYWFAEFTRFVCLAYLSKHLRNCIEFPKFIKRCVRHLAIKISSEKARTAARDVDVLADEVAIDTRNEVVGIEVDIFDIGVEFGCDVIAQPLRIHSELEIAQRVDPRAA